MLKEKFALGYRFQKCPLLVKEFGLISARSIPTSIEGDAIFSAESVEVKIDKKKVLKFFNTEKHVENLRPVTFHKLTECLVNILTLMPIIKRYSLSPLI